MKDSKYSLFSAQQARDLDQIAITEYGYTGLGLMKAAGERAFANIMRYYSGAATIVVLCGSGNNGGDGYVVANCAHGVGMDVIVVQTQEPKTDESIQVFREYVANGGRVRKCDPDEISGAGLIVDGLLGTGLNRAPSGPCADLIRAANHSGCPVVALDIPSGLGSDTGHAFDPCMEADMTITFIGKKFGLFTGQGRNYCGDIKFEDLSLPAVIQESIKPLAKILEPPNLEKSILKKRVRDSHKGDYGNVVVAGGHDGMLGATLLAGRAALRCGSGLVTILSTKKHLDLPALHCPELMSQYIENNSGFDRLRNCSNAIILGPGLGQSNWSKTIFKALIDAEKPMVVDADGLSLLAQNPCKSDHWVLTPHPGEAAILLDCTPADIQTDRFGAVTAITEKYGGVCVLKGAGTLISDQCKKVSICDLGNPGMATAGMGDVLSGIIGSLLGQNLSTGDAAKTGVWLHAACADRKSSQIGMSSLLASDIIEILPSVLSLCLD